MFYDRAGDGAIREVLRSREERLLRVILLDPAYPDPFAIGDGRRAVRSIVTLAPDIQIPYTVQYGAGLERIVTKGTTVAVNYLGSRGVDLFRSRDVNAPPPPLYLARPNPAFGQIRQIESTGRQTAHSLQILARGRLAPQREGHRCSTRSRNRAQRHQRHQRAAGEQLRSGERVRPRRLRSAASPRGTAPVQGGRLGGLRRHCSLASGRPYSLRTGRDDFHTGQTNARPAGVARNTLQGPGSKMLDLRWSHEFRSDPARETTLPAGRSGSMPSTS